MLGLEPQADAPTTSAPMSPDSTSGWCRAGAAGHDVAGGVLARVGIEAKLAEVTAAGGTVNEQPHDVGNGRRVASFTDLDGNVLACSRIPEQRAAFIRWAPCPYGLPCMRMARHQW